MTTSNIHIEDFNYHLPPEKIAQYPLEKRDHSKLLIYDNDSICDDIFYNIQNHLPSESLLVFNDTKVIHARLLFKKESGSVIEIFCLEPSHQDIQFAFQQTKSSEWKCLVGNNKRWKSGLLKIETDDVILYAEKINNLGEEYLIRFSWEPHQFSFSHILEMFGKVPLPPYISRPSENTDAIRYQTVFAQHEGSVAAPTAGLHFTNDLLQSLESSGIKRSYITLHVGAGTFKPVTTFNVLEHQMHEEHININKQLLENLLSQKNKTIIPVGTTSLRTLESLYCMGVKKILKKENFLYLDQWEAYELEKHKITKDESLSALIQLMNDSGSTSISGTTKLMIVPDYKFKIASAIITNFHQPQSTLLLLVAAMIGNKWKNVYEYALKNNYRFLSYGDCCLFFIPLNINF